MNKTARVRLHAIALSAVFSTPPPLVIDGVWKGNNAPWTDASQ